MRAGADGDRYPAIGRSIAFEGKPAYDTEGLLLEDMSCRTGPLRVGRPLRGVHTGLAGMISIGPPVGRDHRFRPTGGPMLIMLPRQIKKACKRPPHAQWARPQDLLQALPSRC